MPCSCLSRQLSERRAERYHGTPITQSPKGGVLNARILWIFSRAYHLFGEEEYKALSDRAQHYFIRHFIDKEMGYMNYERVEGNLIRKIDWWPQAESVVAFYNAWQITHNSILCVSPWPIPAT